MRHRPGASHQNADALSRIPHSCNGSNATFPAVTIVPPKALSSTYVLTGPPANPNPCTDQPPNGQWIRAVSTEELRQAQEADANIGQILQLMGSGHDQTRMMLPVACSVKRIRSLCTQWDLLVLRDSLLHRNWEPGDGLHLQLVVPHSLTHDVLTALHDEPSAGHLAWYTKNAPSGPPMVLLTGGESGRGGMV